MLTRSLWKSVVANRVTVEIVVVNRVTVEKYCRKQGHRGKVLSQTGSLWKSVVANRVTVEKCCRKQGHRGKVLSQTGSLWKSVVASRVTADLGAELSPVTGQPASSCSEPIAVKRPFLQATFSADRRHTIAPFHGLSVPHFGNPFMCYSFQ